MEFLWVKVALSPQMPIKATRGVALGSRYRNSLPPSALANLSDSATGGSGGSTASQRNSGGSPRSSASDRHVSHLLVHGGFLFVAMGYQLLQLDCEVLDSAIRSHGRAFADLRGCAYANRPTNSSASSRAHRRPSQPLWESIAPSGQRAWARTPSRCGILMCVQHGRMHAYSTLIDALAHVTQTGICTNTISCMSPSSLLLIGREVWCGQFRKISVWSTETVRAPNRGAVVSK